MTDTADGALSTVETDPAQAPTDTVSDAQQAAQHADSPTVPMPPDHLACLACGVAVALPSHADILTFTAIGKEGQPELITWQRGRLPAVELTRCAACRDRHDDLTEIIEAHPTVFGPMGSLSVAQHQLECVSDFLEVIGKGGDLTPDTSPEALRRLLRRGVQVGVCVRYALRFAPVWHRDADADTASARPWSHVTDEVRQTAREAYAGVLAERIATQQPPRRLTPPDGRACLLCGIDGITMGAAEVVRRGGVAGATRDVWTHMEADLGSLGGKRGPRTETKVHGYTCPACSTAREDIGAVGPTLLEHAVSSWLTEQGDTTTAWQVREGDVHGLVAWAALDGAAPNPQPWEHLRLLP